MPSLWKLIRKYIAVMRGYVRAVADCPFEEEE